MPLEPLKAMLRLAGAPEAVVNSVPEVLKICHVCRTWDKPSSKPIAKSEMALVVNRTIWGDIMFYRRVLQPDRELLRLGHLVDDASRWNLVEELVNKMFGSFQALFMRWM